MIHAVKISSVNDLQKKNVRFNRVIIICLNVLLSIGLKARRDFPRLNVFFNLCWQEFNCDVIVIVRFCCPVIKSATSLATIPERILVHAHRRYQL